MRIIYTILFLTTWFGAHAQLYINGPVTVQAGALLYAQDTIKLDAAGSLIVNGTLESTKDIQTIQSFINTVNTGKVILPIASGIQKSLRIGSGSVAAIGIQHGSSNSVVFNLAVRDQVFSNPELQTTLQTTNAVSNTWLVEPQANVANAIINLGWETNHELGGFARNASFVAHWKAGQNTAWSADSIRVAALTGTTPQYQQQSNVSNLTSGTYYFGVGSAGSVLPVTIIRVKGKSICANTNEVSWLVASASNSSRFVVEWINPETGLIESVGTVNTPPQITQTQQFTFTHYYSEQVGNQVLYRIKHVNLNNTFTYTNWVAIATTPTFTAYELSPNPSNGVFQINNLVQGNVKIMTTMGVELSTINNYSSGQWINVSHLPSGVYYVQITDNLQQQTVKRLIIH